MCPLDVPSQIRCPRLSFLPTLIPKHTPNSKRRVRVVQGANATHGVSAWRVSVCVRLCVCVCVCVCVNSAGSQEAQRGGFLSTVATFKALPPPLSKPWGEN